MANSVAKKKLCKLSRKDIEKNFPEYVELTNDPVYICKKCKRTAKQEKNLCKPKKIKTADAEEQGE
ncbi:MAG: hypothetical protein R6V56_05510 [Lentisphaeria bacterium]